jgi:guanine deaminase
MNKFMKEAIKLGLVGIKKKAGGPFGAVIVCKGKIVGKGYNRVIETNDPTKHAEMVAIADAAKNLKRFDMSDCTIYASGQPCPMCRAAIMWARIKVCYYANSYSETAKIGFDDRQIDLNMKGKASKIKFKLVHIDAKEGLGLYEAYCKKPHEMY